MTKRSITPNHWTGPCLAAAPCGQETKLCTQDGHLKQRAATSTHLFHNGVLKLMAVSFRLSCKIPTITATPENRPHPAYATLPGSHQPKTYTGQNKLIRHSAAAALGKERQRKKLTMKIERKRADMSDFFGLGRCTHIHDHLPAFIRTGFPCQNKCARKP